MIEKDRNKSSNQEDMADISVIIGKNIKMLRVARGYTQRDIAKILDVSYQQVQKYEAGVNRFSAKDLYVLKNYLKVSYDSFYQDISMGDNKHKINILLASVSNTPMEEKIVKIIEILCSDYEWNHV